MEFTYVEGYINLIVDFFDVDFNCETKTIRGVFYDIDHLPLLQKLNKKTLKFVVSQMPRCLWKT